MWISWSSGLRRRVAAVATSAVLVGGGVGAVAVANAPTAGAVGATHKTPSSARSTALANEKAARLSFSCNDATGAYKLKLTNVQVIKADTTSRWDNLILFGAVNGTVSGGGGEPVVVFLSQNTTNGLFGGSASGTLASAANCHTGAQFDLIDVDDAGGGSLHFSTSLG